MKLKLFCPRMNIHFIRLNLKLTDPEPMVATIVFDDNTQLAITPVTIPPTPVYRNHLLNPFQWTVAPCVGKGNDGHGNYLLVELAEEQCDFVPSEGTVCALPMPYVCTLTLADGRVAKGTLIPPNCPIDLLSMPIAATPLTIEGELTIS